MKYDLEFDRIAEHINKASAKTVLIQLPDGLKPEAKRIQDNLKGKIDSKTKVLFWSGSCFGACDVPIDVERMGVDLLIQLGHSEWR